MQAMAALRLQCCNQKSVEDIKFVCMMILLSDVHKAACHETLIYLCKKSSIKYNQVHAYSLVATYTKKIIQ